MVKISQDIIFAYNQSRTCNDKAVLCHAPFTNINFEQTGNATVCCYNRKHVLGVFPKDSLTEIWFGAQAESIRNYIRENNLDHGCRMCGLQLQSKNYAGVKAKLYDVYAENRLQKASSWLGKFWGKEKVLMPKVIEFELENTCNLECIMCNGDFSSSIRKNREKRPPQKSPYTKEFVQQLALFMPSLTDMKFLGGEPFMIDIYYDIWELASKVNPSIMMHITTNATMLNSRTKKLLEGMKAGINVSIDSVEKRTYEYIRIGATYERVIENLDWLIDYTHRKKTYLWFSVCPMVINRFEIPDIIRYANQRDIGVYFNTVWWPEDQTIRFMPYAELDELIAFYSQIELPENTRIEKINANNFDGFVSQVKFWKTEKEMPETAEHIPLLLKSTLDALNVEGEFQLSDLAKQVIKITQTEEDWRTKIMQLSKSVDDIDFLHAYLQAITCLANGYLNEEEFLLFCQKVEAINIVNAKLKEKHLLVVDLVRSGLLYQVNYISNTSVEELETILNNHYC